MNNEELLNSLRKYTVEEFQKDFDNLMSLIETDKKSFIITSEHGEVVIMPADAEIIRIHTELNNEAP